MYLLKKFMLFLHRTINIPRELISINKECRKNTWRHLFLYGDNWLECHMSLVSILFSETKKRLPAMLLKVKVSRFPNRRGPQILYIP